jgi:hypothetical protein
VTCTSPIEACEALRFQVTAASVETVLAARYDGHSKRNGGSCPNQQDALTIVGKLRERSYITRARRGY